MVAVLGRIQRARIDWVGWGCPWPWNGERPRLLVMKPIQAKVFVAGAVSVVLLLSGSGAAAAVVLEFTPASGRMGDRVRGRAAGLPLADRSDLQIFLAPSHRAADRARGPDDPRLVRFGRVRVDDEDVGRFSGIVPRLAAGDYVAVAHCRTCIPGGSTFTVGDFTIAGAALPATGPSPRDLVAVGLALIVAGAVASIRLRVDAQGGTSG